MYIKVQESINCRKNFHKFLGLKEALFEWKFLYLETPAAKTFFTKLLLSMRDVRESFFKDCF